MPALSDQSPRTSRRQRRQVLDTSSSSNADDSKDSSDLEIETSSQSSSDSEAVSSDEHNDSSTSSCCLICSIEPKLSRINTCPTHLAFLTLSRLSRRHVYRSRAKRRYQSSHSSPSSSSSSSSISSPRRKRRSLTVHSSSNSSDDDDDDQFFSPTAQSQATSNPVSLNKSPIDQRREAALPSPFLSRTKQRSSQVSSTIELTDSSDNDLDPSFTPSILLDRVVHVKDDGELLNSDSSNRLTITMAQATEQMQNQIHSHPRIRLKRVTFE